MKIAVIFTGGTIGSIFFEDIIDVDLSAREKLIAYVEEHLGDEIEFDISQPLNMLSENMTPYHYQILHQHIRSLDIDSYDGIIITHGSDTIPYTAAMLSYLFAHISIPMVLTASNYPLDDPRANGKRNFLDSIRFIQEGIPGIFTVFEDGAGNGIVYLGTRMLEASHMTDLFQSFGDIIFGEIVDGNFIHNDSSVNPTPEMLCKKRQKQFDQSLVLDAPFMVIKPYPGLNYKYYHFGQHKPKAIIHDLYHSATHNTMDETPNESLKTYIEYCHNEGIEVYLVPFRKSEEKMYASSKKLLDAGAKPLRNISMISSITKVILAYSFFETQAERDNFIQKNVFFEYVDTSISV